MNDREAFLARVREASAAARGGSAEQTPPPPDDRLARLVDRGADAPAIFRARAAAAGAVVVDAADWAAALARELRERSVRKVTLSIGDDVLREEARRVLAGAGIEILTAGGRQTQFIAEAGVTDCIAGVAETGSIVLASSPEAPRLTAFIPPIHIALVSRARIVPDLLDFFAGAREMPAALTLISAPSKTADIEGILITGVHGPAELVLVLF